MARGVLSGIGLGAVFSVGMAGVVSVLLPMTPQKAPELGSAEDIAAPAAPAATAPVSVTPEGERPAPVPQASLRAPASEELPTEPAVAAQAPQIASDLEAAVQDGGLASARVTTPEFETARLAPLPAPLRVVESALADGVPHVPQTAPKPLAGAAENLTVPRPLPAAVAPRAGEDAPVLPNPQALAPMIPDDGVDAQISAQNPAPVVVQNTVPETQIAVAPAVQDLPETTPTPGSAPTPEAETDQGDTEQSDDMQIAAVIPKPRVLPAPGTQGGVSGADARVRIGTPASTIINRTVDGDSAPVETVSQAAGDSTSDSQPVRRYAQPFENTDAKPLMSIVLIDSGADLDAAEIGLPALSRFPYPVSFAVDANLIDAAERVERYRGEGFDVLAMVDLPQGARPADAEVSLSVAINGLPEIIGVLEGTGEGLQGSREVADQVTSILKASGHGLVTQSKGLNSMPKLALKEGVPAAPVFRDFDSEGQQPRVIRRFLDQAAFKAGQEGGVIVLGRLRPETIEALLVWGLADRAGSVALAPVSAVLLDQR